MKVILYTLRKPAAVSSDSESAHVSAIEVGRDSMGGYDVDAAAEGGVECAEEMRENEGAIPLLDSLLHHETSLLTCDSVQMKFLLSAMTHVDDALEFKQY